jgi:hypothetical protein
MIDCPAPDLPPLHRSAQETELLLATPARRTAFEMGAQQQAPEE